METANYPAPGFFERKIEKKTAAKVAAFLRALSLDVENTGSTGVRADWMEQDGPALFSDGEISAASGVPLGVASHIMAERINADTTHCMTFWRTSRWH